MHDLLVDVSLAVGFDLDGLIRGIGVDIAQGHGGNVKEAHGGLAGKEVRHLLFDARHIGSRDHSLFDGDRPDGAQAGDVTGAVNIRVIGPARLIIDKTCAGQLEAGILQEFDIGAHAGGDDEEVAGDHGAIAENDRGDLMLFIDLHFIDADSVVLFHAACRKGVDIGFGSFRVQLFVEEPAREITEDDFDAELKEAGGAVDADQA